MATGTPKARHQAKSMALKGKASQCDEFRLEYSNKCPESQVLAFSHAPEFATLWRGRRNGAQNRLYYAENMGVLASLMRDRTVRGNVRMVYIDPPFATQSVFHSRQLDHAYDDTLAGAEFVEFLRMRLILLRELLAGNGSIYLHLDEKMIFPMKIVMDEVFGAQHFRNCIVRKKCNPKNYTRRTYGKITDYILFYTKSDDYVWNRPVEQWTEERAAKEYEYFDATSGRRYKKVPIHAPGVRHGETGKPWRGMLPPPGKHWQFTPTTLDAMDRRGEIYWSPNGNPRRLVFLDQSNGIGVQDMWLNFRDAYNQNIKITGYPTEKNPKMIGQIISASSNPGDLVLDCFSGSGTTLEQASKLGRFWIGVDNSTQAILTTLQRLAIGAQRMGDFVGARNGIKKLPLPERNRNLPLFDFRPDDTGSADIESQHQPIVDFSLLGERGKNPLPLPSLYEALGEKTE